MAPETDRIPMTAKTETSQEFLALAELARTVAESLTEDVEAVAQMAVRTLRNGGRLYFCGNGGSAADAQHLAAEFIGRFMRDRKALPAIALTTDTSILTAIGNDFGFDEVFKKQVEALAAPGDVVLGISTSGKSNNVFYGLTKANEIGCTTIGLLGRQGGNISGIVDVSLIVPAQETPFIQEAHVTILHLLCDLVEQEICALQQS